jgi:hypothetical protein
LTTDRKDYNQPYTNEKELLLLIGDWYHRPASEVLEWYMDPGNFGNEVSWIISVMLRKVVANEPF